MGFELKLDGNVALSAGKGGTINTGVHSIKVLNAFLSTTKKGDNVVELELESSDGSKANVYNLCITEKWKSGSVNHDYKVWQELINVAGLKSGDTTSVERTKFDGTKEQVDSINGLKDVQVIGAIQVQFEEYNGDEKKKRKLTRVFYTDGKSLAEKQAGKPAKQSIALSESIKDYYTKSWKQVFGAGAKTLSDASPSEEQSESDAANLLG